MNGTVCGVNVQVLLLCYVTAVCRCVCLSVCLLLIDAPEVAITPEERMAIEGQKFSLQCSGKGNPE